MSMPSLSVLPSPSPWRVGVRVLPFEACSAPGSSPGVTHVAAGRIAQPPKAAFVARLRPSRSPSQAARQLPDPSTLIRVEPPSTRETRRQGAHREHKLRPNPARQSPTLLMSGEGKRGDWPCLEPPRPSSTLPCKQGIRPWPQGPGRDWRPASARGRQSAPARDEEAEAHSAVAKRRSRGFVTSEGPPPGRRRAGARPRRR